MAGTIRTRRGARLAIVGLVTALAATLVPVVAAATPAAAAHGGAGDLDPSFAGDGTATGPLGVPARINDVVVQADGKSVVVGTSATAGDAIVARFNADGTLDPTFGGGDGWVAYSAPRREWSSLALRPDGRIVVGGVRSGTTTGTTFFEVGQLTADGSIDPTFFPAGGGFQTHSMSPGDHHHADVLLQSDGKIVLTGWVPSTTGGPGEIVAVRYLADGSTDSSYGDNSIRFVNIDDDRAYGATIQPDNKVVIVGSVLSTTADTADVEAAAVVRLTTDGQLDTTFDTDGISFAAKYGGTGRDRLHDVAVDGLGRIVATGMVEGICLTSGGDALTVARLTSTGAADSTFSNVTGRRDICTGDSYRGDAVAVDSSDRVLVGGQVRYGTTEPMSYGTVVQRFTSAGQLDDAFGLINGFASPSGTIADARTGVLALAVQSDGKTLVAGHHGGGWFLARLTSDLLPPDPPSLLLAYESNASGFSEIWTAGADGSGATQRTALSSFAAFPSFLDADDLLFESAVDGDFDIWARYGDGTTEKLTENTVHDGVPAVSPDRTRVAFMSDQPAPLGRGVFVATVADLQAAPADTTRWTKVATLASTSFGRPAWAPEGDRLAFHTGGEMWVVGADGTGLRQITNDSVHDQDGSWSGVPGDDRIAFSRFVTTGRTQLFLVDADDPSPSATVRPLLAADSGFHDTTPAFSPDGAFVAFTRGGGSDDIYLVDLATQTERAVVATGALERRPAWQPVIPTLSLTALAAGPQGTSPRQVPGVDIPLQDSPHVQQSSAIESAPAALLGIDTTPAGLLGIDTTPAALLSLDTTPAALLSLDTTPAALLSLDTTPAALLSLDTTPAAAREMLDSILLSQLDPSPLTWEEILGRPVVLQSTSLLDVIIEDPANLSSVQLVHLMGDGSPLDSLSVAGVMLGPVTVGRIAEPSVWDDPSSASWSTRVGNALGDPAFTGSFLMDADDPSAGSIPVADMPLMWLELAGVPLDGTFDAALPFQAVPLRHIDLLGDANLAADDAPLASFVLADADLANTSLGLVTVGTLPAATRSAVTSCGAPCDAMTLHELQQAGQLQGTAPLSALLDGAVATVPGSSDADSIILGEVVSAFMGLTERPFGFVDPALVAGYSDPAHTTAVPYQLSYTGPLSNAVAKVTAPASFVYEAGSAIVTVDGLSEQVEPTIASVAGKRVLTWDLGLEGVGSLDINFEMLTGITLGTFDLSAKVTTIAGTSSVDHAAGVEIVPGFVGGSSVAGAVLVEPERLYLPAFSGAASKHLYRIPAGFVPEGSRIDIQVGNIASGFDLDAVLYRDLGSAEAPLRPPSVERDAILPVPDDGIDLSDSGEPLAAEIRADIHFEELPVMAAGANRGNAAEHLTARVPTGGGDLILQVSPYLGQQPTKAYTLFIRTAAPPTPVATATTTSCPSRGSELFAHDSDPYGPGGKAETTVGTMPAAIAPDRQSLLLVNRDRISDIYGEQAAADVMAALNALVTDPTVGPKVKGLVLPIDGDPAVRAAYHAWDLEPCSVRRANDVVRAINAAVDALRLDAGGEPVADIKHMVLFGDDDMLPFARIPDSTQQDNESTYAPVLSFLPANNPLRAAYTAGMIPSDDGYGDLDPEPWLDRFLYVTDVAMGRVVENPTDWIAAVNRFIQFKGEIDPSTALTTAYDFMADMGQEVDSTVETQLGSAQPQLIDPPTPWTADDLRAAFTPGNPTPPDLMSFNGHFSHWFMEPSSGTETFGTDELTAGQVRKMIHSIGCHSGTSISDVVVGSVPAGVAARYRDWAEALGEKGTAGYVGQTGYGLGLDGLTALSERIMADYAAFLDGSVTTGTALLEAKQRYRRDVGTYGVYDEKALVEATYYGLSFWSIKGSAPTAPTDPPPVTSPAPYTDILTASVIDVEPTFTVLGTSGGSILKAAAPGARSGFVTTANRPVQPALHYTLGAGARDGIVLSYDASDRTGWNPDYANPLVSDAAKESGQEDGNVVFPAAPLGVIDGQLTVIPGQFRTADPVTGTGVQRQYDEMRVLVTHGSGQVSQIRPRFGAIDSAVIPAGSARSATWRVEVTDPDGQVGRVVALYEDSADPGKGRSVDFVRQAGTDVWTAGATVSGDKVLYALQACDVEGWCSHIWNKGLLFEAGEPAPSPGEISGEITVDVTGTPDPAPNGWFTSATLTLGGPEGVTFQYRRPSDADFQPYTGPVAVNGPDGVNLIEWRASSGDSGVVPVPIDTAAPTVSIFRPAPNQGFQVGSVVEPVFSCADAGSGVASCSPSANPLDTSTVGSKTFTVVATDRVGRTTSKSVGYRVEYEFNGFLNPVKNDVLNAVKGGSTVPVKWQLRDQNGYVRMLTVVQVINHQQIECEGMSVVEMQLIDLPLTTLHYDLFEEQYVFGFKTDKAWKNTCRSLHVRLSDGSVHTAHFMFT